MRRSTAVNDGQASRVDAVTDQVEMGEEASNGTGSDRPQVGERAEMEDESEPTMEVLDIGLPAAAGPTSAWDHGEAAAEVESARVVGDATDDGPQRRTETGESSENYLTAMEAASMGTPTAQRSDAPSEAPSIRSPFKQAMEGMANRKRVRIGEAKEMAVGTRRKPEGTSSRPLRRST